MSPLHRSDPNTGQSAGDFSFAGKKGDLMSFEVLSPTRLGSNTIDSVIRIRDANGNVLAFNGGSAVNDDQFEPTDSSIFDFRTADGYIVEVDTFSSATTPHTDTGATNCSCIGSSPSMPMTAATSSRTRRNDNLMGGLGNDTVNGGTGNERRMAAPGAILCRAAVGQRHRRRLRRPRHARLQHGDAGNHLNLSWRGPDTNTRRGRQDAGLERCWKRYSGRLSADLLTGNARTMCSSVGLNTRLRRGWHDLLIGGAGIDSLQGQGGDDLLIGGRHRSMRTNRRSTRSRLNGAAATPMPCAWRF